MTAGLFTPVVTPLTVITRDRALPAPTTSQPERTAGPYDRTFGNAARPKGGVSPA